MRRTVLIATLIVAGTLVVQTGGYSALSAERNFDVAVAEDSNAFLGIHPGETTGRVGHSLEILRLEDNFGAETDATLERVWVEQPGGPVTLQTWAPKPLDTSIGVRCRGPTEGAEPVTLHLEVVAEGVTVELSRTVRVSCHKPKEAANGSVASENATG